MSLPLLHKSAKTLFFSLFTANKIISTPSPSKKILSVFVDGVSKEIRGRYASLRPRLVNVLTLVSAIIFV